MAIKASRNVMSACRDSATLLPLGQGGKADRQARRVECTADLDVVEPCAGEDAVKSRPGEHHRVPRSVVAAPAAAEDPVLQRARRRRLPLEHSLRR